MHIIDEIKKELGLDASVHEVVSSRTHQTATFNLGGNKRVAFSQGFDIFVPDETGAMQPIIGDGVVEGTNLVFAKQSRLSNITIDLTKPKYTIHYGGKWYSVQFNQRVSGVRESTTKVSYQLSANIKLFFEVVRGRIKRTIELSNSVNLIELEHTVTYCEGCSDSLVKGDIVISVSGTPYYSLEKPEMFYFDANRNKVDVPVNYTFSNGKYGYNYDESIVQYPCTIDPSEGPLSPGTAVDDASIGSTVWNNPTNVFSSENLDATTNFISSTGPSHYLKATNFGFAIPANDVIDGIKVEFEKAHNLQNSVLLDNAVRIVKGGNIGSTDKSLGSFWPNGDTYVSHGGSTDLWGETWTHTDINDTNFGVAISVKHNTGIGTEAASLDHVRITVYYTEAPPAAGNGNFLFLFN